MLAAMVTTCTVCKWKAAESIVYTHINAPNATIYTLFGCIRPIRVTFEFRPLVVPEPLRTSAFISPRNSSCQEPDQVLQNKIGRKHISMFKNMDLNNIMNNRILQNIIKGGVPEPQRTSAFMSPRNSSCQESDQVLQNKICPKYIHRFNNMHINNIASTIESSKNII